ncbi:MAG TPA: ELWxxDGT repeat protein, partial [Thermoanaerobaculia bacterium]|nr:ELWxxDGT repeat protein [Thermoanaerobaculia bacterium]
VFTASARSIGREIWIADGESHRTYPLGDLCRGSCDIEPRIVGTVGSTLFFVESRASNTERLLWASDGTPRGTRALLDSAGVEASVLFAGRALFVVAAESGPQLWRSDGTSGGTAQLATVGGPGIYDVIGFEVVGSRALLLLRHEGTLEVWSTDGSTAGTNKVAAIPADYPSGELHAATATHAFFLVDTTAGQKLWASDGTAAGTRAVTAFAARSPFDQTHWLKPLGKHVYFLADDVIHGRELWRSDGTPKGTTRVTEFGYALPFEDPYYDSSQLEELNGKLVFFATDGLSPFRLWTSNGSPTSTRPLSGVCPDPCFLGDEPWLRRFGNRLFFPVGYGEIWFTDGTAAGSGPLVGACPDPCFGNVSVPRVLGDRLYFVGDSEEGQELWSSDGTAAGTHQVTHFEDAYSFDLSPSLRSAPVVMAAGGRLWFPAQQYPYGQELWSTAGAPETTELAADIARGSASSDPIGFAPFGDRVLFAAGVCDHHAHELLATDGTSTQRLSTFITYCGDRGLDREGQLVTSGPYAYFWRYADEPTLWRSDGTPAGLVELATFPQRFVSSPLPVDGGVAFIVQHFPTRTASLWQSDGTVVGTVKRLDLPGLPEFPFAAGQSVYFFAAAASATTRQVWRADLGSGTVAALTTFGVDNAPTWREPWFTKLGSEVYFWLLPSGDRRITLWRSDGTSAGTVAAFELSVADGAEVFGMRSVAGALYIHTRLYTGSAYHLLRSDGSAAGSTRLGTFNTRAANDVPPIDIAEAGGRVFFVGDDLAHGREPWSTDGTPEGTRLLRDVVPGVLGSSPAGLTAGGGRVSFTADDDIHGRELWQSDGTEAGTRLVHDIAPGAFSSQPAHLTVAGTNLFFAADDGLSGNEPWVLPLAGPTACVASDTVLCLGAGRFRVEAVWRDFAGNGGIGHAAPLTADTGTFWFFSPSNVEVILKVLDGRGVNDHQWVFYGALSSVEYTLTVTDTQTGAVRRYVNPAGRLASIGDTEAFGPRGAAALRRSMRTAAAASPPALVDERRDEAAKTVCVASATRLCLADGRFGVEVAWRDFAGNHGVGTATALSTDTGDFWFFSADNVELVVKVLDGRPVNGKFWFFYGALSSVEYTLTVTDTATGTVRTYTNPSGRLASFADTAAF